MRITRDHCLVAFILLPRNVTGMVVWNQDRPLGPRFLVAIRFPGSPLNNRGSRLRFAKGISAGIDWVREQSQDRVVNRQVPNRSPAGLIKDQPSGRTVWN